MYSVLFIANVPPLEDEIINRIKSYLMNGGSVVMMPGVLSMPRVMNNLLNRLEIKSTILNLTESKYANEYFRLARPPANSPIVQGLYRHINHEYDLPIFKRYFLIDNDKNSHSILEFNNQDAFIVKNQLKQGKFFLITSYIDQDWTDLQYKGLFVPLMTRILTLASPDISYENHTFISADEYNTGLNQDWINGPGEFNIVTPDDKKVKIIPNQSYNQSGLSIPNLTLPGNYRIFKDENCILVISVNIKRDYRRKYFFTTKKNLENLIWYKFDEDALFENELIESRLGFEFWKILVFITIVIIFIEILIIRKTER